MKLIYKFMLPILIVLLLTIFFVTFFLQQSLSQALFQEEFFRVNEAIFKTSSEFFREEYFKDPFNPVSQNLFEAFANEVGDSTMARFTIWGQNKVILYSDLRSVIGLPAVRQQELDRALREGRALYVRKASDDGDPLQSAVGEFLDIYVPVRVSDSMRVVVQVQSVTGAVLLPVMQEIRNITYSLLAAMAGVFVVIVVAFRIFIFRPMKILENTAVEVSRSNFSSRANLKSKDEIGYFASIFDQMLFYVQAYQDKMKNYTRQVEEEVKLRTKELTEERARLLASINSFPIGFILANKEGKIYLSNKALLGIFSSIRSLESIGEITALVNNSIDIHRQHQLCMENREFYSMPEIVSGSKILHMVLAPVVAGKDGEEVIGTVMLVEDITERKVLERSKDEFFSIASHELRTPLTAIRGNASLILDFYKNAVKDKQVHEMIEDIFKSSTLLLRIANDFLDVVRLEQGKIAFKKETVNVPAVAREVVKEVKELAAEKKIALRVEPSKEKIPPVSADSDRVKQILIGLVGNAIHYTVKGSIAISFKRADKVLKVYVKDTGIGIDPKRQGLLFKKFQQAQEKILTRNVTQGTGLGLYISRLMVEAMGGSIVLEESSVGKGSVFSFTLPVA